MLLFDNEAVQALGDAGHPKHRRVLAHVQTVVTRHRRRSGHQLAVPTAVRVEAGWDRRSPSSALLNRLRITDIPLDTTQANAAAGIRGELGNHISVTDAHLGAAIQTAGGSVVVLTSDPGDMRAVAGAAEVKIVAI